MFNNKNEKSRKNYHQKFNNDKELKNLIFQNDLRIQSKITPFIRADICSHFPSRPRYYLNYYYSEENLKYSNNNRLLTKPLSECDTLSIRKIKKDIKNNEKYSRTNKNNNKKDERAHNILTAHLIYAKNLNECSIINKSDQKIIEIINFNKDIKQFFKINPYINDFYLNQKCSTFFINYYCAENIIQTKLRSNVLQIKIFPHSETSLYSFDTINKPFDDFNFSWDILESFIPSIPDMSVSISFTISLDFTNSSLFSTISSESRKKYSIETNLAINYTNIMIEYCSDCYGRTSSGTFGRLFIATDKPKFSYRNFGCLDGIVKTKKVTKEISKENSHISECFLALSHMFSLRKLLGREVSKCNQFSTYKPFTPVQSDSDTLINSSLESVDSYDKELTKKFEKSS